MELLPLKTTFGIGEPVVVELRGAPFAVHVELWHLDRVVARRSAQARAPSIVRFPPQPNGGYGVIALGTDGAMARTALDVLEHPLRRPRYGFVSGFEPGRDAVPVVDHFRRLHLNAVQFYDWMYRHASLLPPEESFVDPLGRRISLDTVRRLVDGLQAAGSIALGYAAVYAVGPDEWPAWRAAGLLRPDGEPWTLGRDFLSIVDPSDRRWSWHLAGELRRAVEAVGFSGFHLDQYGWPKRALRGDGSVVDLAAAFPKLIRRLHRALPEARLIFNNVNAFPLWSTASAPQDAVYVEVWPPHHRLGHLAELVSTSRHLAPEKPPILAAYLSPYSGADFRAAERAAKLVMATIFSHGGFHLLCGEEGAVLTDPYYPRHARLGARGREMFRRWYDFAVRYGDLLFLPEAGDITRTVLGGVNEELRVEGAVPVATDPEPGVVWARVVALHDLLVVHLINLVGQEETNWNAPKRPIPTIRGLRLSVLRQGRSAPTFAAAEPDRRPDLQRLRSTEEDGRDVVRLPPLGTWMVILLRSW